MVALVPLALAVLCAGPAAAAPNRPANGPAAVAIHNRPIFEIEVADGSAAPADRARAAETILARLLEDSLQAESPPLVSAQHLPADPNAVPPTAEGWSLQLNGHQFLRLTPEDVVHSGLPPDVYLESLVAKVRALALRERRRAALQGVLQAISLTVFLGLLTFLALRAIWLGGQRTRARLEARLARLHGLRLRGVELVSPETLEGTSYALVGLGRITLQIALLYGYLAFALSQFAWTRGWVAPLTVLLTSPFVALLSRLGNLLPGLVVLIAAGFLLRGALRLADFLLQRVARGEFKWRWLPADRVGLAQPLVRAGLVVVALVAFVGLAGGGDGLLARIFLWAVAAVALALVPLLAAAAVGAAALVSRSYRMGEWVAIGGRIGEVTHVGFFALTLVPTEAGRVRIPHLVTLWTAVQHLPGPPTPLNPLASSPSPQSQIPA